LPVSEKGDLPDPEGDDILDPDPEVEKKEKRSIPTRPTTRPTRDQPWVTPSPLGETDPSRPRDLRVGMQRGPVSATPPSSEEKGRGGEKADIGVEKEVKQPKPIKKKVGDALPRSVIEGVGTIYGAGKAAYKGAKLRTKAAAQGNDVPVPKESEAAKKGERESEKQMQKHREFVQTIWAQAAREVEKEQKEQKEQEQKEQKKQARIEKQTKPNE